MASTIGDAQNTSYNRPKKVHRSSFSFINRNDKQNNRSLFTLNDMSNKKKQKRREIAHSHSGIAPGIIKSKPQTSTRLLYECKSPSWATHHFDKHCFPLWRCFWVWITDGMKQRCVGSRGTATAFRFLCCMAGCARRESCERKKCVWCMYGSLSTPIY